MGQKATWLFGIWGQVSSFKVSFANYAGLYSMHTMKPLRYFVPSDNIPLALTERQACHCVMRGEEEPYTVFCRVCMLSFMHRVMRANTLPINDNFDGLYCNAGHDF